jgi:selenide,water dikinase
MLSNLTQPVSRSRPGAVLDRDQVSERCGCLAKLDGVALGEVVADAFRAVPGAGPPPTAQPDDCAVLPPIERGVLASVDFGPLVGPDLQRAGRIAAAHALSDVHAMGGTPTAALALLVVDRRLPASAPADVLSGIVAGCAADGVTLAGGHTIVGDEALAGLAVIGGRGERLLEKRGTAPGQRLMLSKPLGSGLVLRAYRHGLLDQAALEPALQAMERSNRAAAQAALAAGARSATDVTGFGLLGHLAELVAADGLGAVVELERVPLLDAVRGLPASLARSQWIDGNLAYCRRLTGLAGVRDRERIAPLLDPQTSGGLLVAVPPALEEELCAAGFEVVGTVVNNANVEVI